MVHMLKLVATYIVRMESWVFLPCYRNNLALDNLALVLFRRCKTSAALPNLARISTCQTMSDGLEIYLPRYWKFSTL